MYAAVSGFARSRRLNSALIPPFLFVFFSVAVSCEVGSGLMGK